jgi:putative transposase
MTTTLDAVKSKKQDSSAEETAAKELVRLATEQGLSLTGPDGLLKQFTKTVLETALNEEMTEHLGHEKNQADPGRDSANVRNGSRPKTVLTEATGQVTIEVPRDRDGSFQPQIVRKRQRRLTGVDDHRGDQCPLRAYLWCIGVEGDDLPDHRQSHRGDANLAVTATG